MARTKKKIEKLPSSIRNELRILCALRGHSLMKGGKGKTIKQQVDFMNAFCHRKEPSCPSQIKLSCSGTLHCGALHEAEQRISASKADDSGSTADLALKKMLNLHPSRKLRSAEEINVLDLEKKCNSSPLLATGRTSSSIAKKGCSYHGKVLSFASQKWKLDENKPIGSGAAIDGLMRFASQEMRDCINAAALNDLSDEEDLDEKKKILRKKTMRINTCLKKKKVMMR